MLKHLIFKDRNDCQCKCRGRNTHSFFPIPELYNAAKPNFCIFSLIIIKYITVLLPMCPFFTSPVITLVFLI